MGAALQPSYLFTFPLQDYIGIIIVFYGAFFLCLALFKGPVDLRWWRKIDPLLRDSITEEENAAAHNILFFFFFFSIFLQVPISGGSQYQSWNGAIADTQSVRK